MTQEEFDLLYWLDKMKKKLIIALIIYFLAFLWNNFLLPYGGLFGDWIGYTYSIGDCLYIVSYSLILSIIWR
jgi:hypothetical protein